MLRFATAAVPMLDASQGARLGDMLMPDRPLQIATPLQLWVDLVRDGEERVSTRLPELVESYLVFMLQRHQGDAMLGRRVLALDWLGGQELAGSERADAMRDVGDRCLLIAGLFPRLAQRRNVQPAYYAALGQAAYGEVAVVARAGYAELFARLAQAFAAMLRVLGGLRVTPRMPGASPLVGGPSWEGEFVDALVGRLH